MKTPSPRAPQPPDEAPDHDDDADPTPTGAPLGPTAAAAATNTTAAAAHELHAAARPPLVRSPPVRLRELRRESEEERPLPAHGGSGSHAAADGDDAAAGVAPGGGGELGKPDLARMPSGTEEEKLARLKEAVNVKLTLQARKRSSYGPPKPVLPGAADSGAPISPSLTAAFASPSPSEVGPTPAPTAAQGAKAAAASARPLSAISTQSAESVDSAGTVRAGAPPTAADSKSARTPSYPFPYVPGSPRSWASAVHQPFTSLSPTTSGPPADDRDTPGRASSGILSTGSTPAATLHDFMAPGQGCQTPEDPRFPTPNLYELVLSLNTEPGLEQWWTTVTNMMHDSYKAERVSLVMPLDPTDMENVPWGQKATFSMNGREEFVPHQTVLEQTLHGARPDQTTRDPSTEFPRDFQMQKLHPERLRPRLESRHSYAGHGRDLPPAASDPSTAPGARPAGPQRTVTHASGIPGGIGPGRQALPRVESTGSSRHPSATNPEFSSVAGEVDAGPYAEVFSSLRALDHEVRPLIEVGGVNRVLERGRVVTVTRDYISPSADTTRGLASAKGQGDPGTGTAASAKDAAHASTAKVFGNYRSAFAAENLFGLRRDYEEYEQYPTSPWAQSPAPSPAIQTDEEANPFFASEEQQVEESFSSASETPKDYSQYEQVEAIGVDRASTVIHMPLVHPTLSQPMQSLSMRQSKDRPGPPRRSNTLDLERKAPIAILSVLSPTVPYPPHLTRSLKLLGPHLATSFAIAQQFSSSHAPTVSIRHRRTVSGHHALSSPMTIEPTSLEDIVNAELEEPVRSMSGSVTSPSDYSGRSRHSPSSSIVGTPGWDPAVQGWTSSRSVATTPAVTGTEMVDTYFGSKRRSAARSFSNTTSTSAQATPTRAATKPSSQETKLGSGKDDTKTPLGEQRLRPSKSVKEDKSTLKLIPEREGNAASVADTSPPQRLPLRQPPPPPLADPSAESTSRRHSLLHSYGADFEASFGSLPGGVSVDPSSSPRLGGHSRKSSYPEDMPPPSERLLRTIIDSVPVQIFTAKPDTGQLSWVNSKFLIYRGQEPRQVLSEPWHAIHPEDRSEFMASWHRSLRTAQQLQQKVRLQRFDGSFRWFYVRAAPLKDKRQRIVHWIGTMMDFHEQHLAELNASRQQETAASEAKYRALANSSPQIVFAVSRKIGVTFCNSQWHHYSGQVEVEALGVGFVDHVHPEDLAKCRLPTFDDSSSLPKNVPVSVPPDLKRTDTTPASSSGDSSDSSDKDSSTPGPLPVTQQPTQRKLSQLASSGILKVARDADGRPSYSTEVRLKSKDGEFRWHLVRVLLAEPMFSSNDGDETWYGTCTDINDHKTLERDLKETMDEKSRFLSNMSHEIRTPLNGIMGMVNFLIDSNLSSEQMEHVNIIRASTEGLRGLINDILDLSKAEAGMIHLSIDWLHVRALIEEVNDLTSAMAIDKGLELNYIVEEDVPRQIKGDRFRIRQVLLNIIGNAIKFTERGEVFVRCSAMPAVAGELANNEMYIKFEVIDTGRGFTEKEAEHLFKRFSQIDDSITRQHGGTGLGLVISRQLAQLHGGDMNAKAAAGKGSTFTFFIKTTLPTKHDRPPVPPPTPSGGSVPILPMSSSALKAPSVSEGQAKASPKFLAETTASPSPRSPDMGRESPSVSSASSDPSLRSVMRTSSLRSERSSVSSYAPDPASTGEVPINPAVPSEARSRDSTTAEPPIPKASAVSPKTTTLPSGIELTSPSGSHAPPTLYSILVLCPLKYSREATVRHIEKTLPKNVPHQITARERFNECEDMLNGNSPVVFTHIVVVLQDVNEITALMDQVLSSPAYSMTSIVIITDLAHRRELMEQAPEYDYNQLSNERRLRFVFKPLKPSRFAVIFDPQKEREMSTDRNQDSAQQVALTQKQVFEELSNRLGNRDKRVLLVEDNRVNQIVILKFLAKVHIPVETVLDGVQCTDKVFSHPSDYYNIILCDLHMPNKDGYQTCKEIRKWEKKKKYPHLPIIALSANVLGDVYQKCAEAGFNSYLTKPVDFKELSSVLMMFMDPSDPTKPHEFMKDKRPALR